MLEYFTTFVGVFLAVLVLTPVSQKIGLLDRPDGDRKQHEGAVPLIGGIAIFSTVALSALAFVPPSGEMAYLLTACALLAMTGTLDDRYNLNAYLRLLVQLLAGYLLTWGSNTLVLSLGDLFGLGPVHLGWLAIPFTILATAGLINAYNMIDGIDGLAGGISLISCLTLTVLLYDEIADGAVNILFLLMGALSAYLIINLNWLPRVSPRIFLGDAGSMMLGFIITAFVIRYSSGGKQVFEPTTALWVVALPLMDIFVTATRRIMHGKNPFTPDRTHVHHILQHAGLSSRITLLVLLSIQLVLCSIGVLLEKASAPQWLSALLFVSFFITYYQLVKHAFRTSKWIRKNTTR